eukprot:g2547.t1
MLARTSVVRSLVVRGGRLQAQRLLSSGAGSAVQTADVGGLPSAEDVAVRVTLIDFYGKQHKICGRVGQTLVDVCAANDLGEVLECDASGGGHRYSFVHNDRWTEDKFGEGPQSALSHVVVSNEWYQKLPSPLPHEVSMLEDMDEGVLTPNSRLGSEIVLTSDLNGMTVYVPDPPVSKLE